MSTTVAACRPRRRSRRRGAAARRPAGRPSARTRCRCAARWSRYDSATSCRAPSTSPPHRSARASGWRAHRCDEVGAAGDDAGLRAAEQLVAAERHECRRRRRASGRAAGSPASHAGGAPAATGTFASSKPLPMSATTGTSSVASSATDVVLDEPLDPVVARVHLQQERDVVAGPARAPVRSRRGGCGWSCRRRRDGPRTAPSPRGPGTSRRSPPTRPATRRRRARRPARRRTSSTAAALLLTTIAASAPAQRREQLTDGALARPALAGREVELDGLSAGLAARGRAGRGRGWCAAARRWR